MREYSQGVVTARRQNRAEQEKQRVAATHKLPRALKAARFVALFIALLTGGCSALGPLWSGRPTESPFGTPPPPATPPPGFMPTLVHNPEIVDDADLLGFLAELEAQGVTPLSVDDSQLELLRPAPGLAYRLSSGRLAIHVFATAAEAHQRAQAVPTEVAQSIADWVGTPHFFECGRLLAMYFGDDPDELGAVGAACASQ